MYDALFAYKEATFAFAVLALALAGLLACRPAAIAARTGLYGYGPTFACAFWLVTLVASPHPELLDVASCFAFELCVLVLSVRLFGVAFSAVDELDLETARRALKVTLLLQIGAFAPLMMTTGFGLFSEGSRIAYLYEGPLARYLTYAVLLLTVVQSGLLARQISAWGRLDRVGVTAVLLNFAASVLSGSKGAVFLWLLSIVALARLDRIRPRHVAYAGVAAAGGLVVLVGVLSNAMGLKYLDFLDLAANRFFLVNDARALAWDLRPVTRDVPLLPEAFRSVAGLVSTPPRNPPLGVFLYDQAFSVTDGSGANTSLTALITAYTTPGYAVLPVVVALAALLGAAVVVRRALRAEESALRRYLGAIVALAIVQTASQDFLAFQVLIVLTAAVAALRLATRLLTERPVQGVPAARLLANEGGE